MIATRPQIDYARVAEHTLNHDHWDTAQDIIRAVMKPNASVVVAGCHSSSKTFVAADIILTTLLVGGNAISTAPTDDQVRGILWQHIHTAIAGSKIPLSEWGDVNQISIRLPTGETAIGRSTNQGVRFQGYHAPEGKPLLIVVDESPGVLPAVFGAISGIRAGGDVRLLVLGNPLVPVGPFYDLFSNPEWTKFHIDAFDTPNLRGVSLEQLQEMPDAELDDNVRPYLATRRWVLSKWREVRGDLKSAEWLGRVRGQFPDYSATTLVWRSWLEQARDRVYRPASTDELVAGIDVAGPGEAETVLCLMRGGHIEHAESWIDSDPRAQVLGTLIDWLPQGLRRVNVDMIGIGWYFYLDIKERLEPLGVRVRPVNVSEASEVLDERGNLKYANLKAGYYWRLREMFAAGHVSGLTYPRMATQLGRIQYKHERGRIQIESKEDAQKRGEESPDWAEALMLASAPDDMRDLVAEAMAQHHEPALGADPYERLNHDRGGFGTGRGW